MENNKAEFKVIPNGPLQVSGDFDLYDTAGRIIKREGPLFLCRCGLSANKPFCDGAHKSSGFVG